MAGQISSTSGTVTKLTAAAKAELAGLMRVGKVTTATSATVFESLDLRYQDDDAFDGWYVSVLQADNAAPEGEMQPMSDYESATGKVTHTAFTQQLAVGDWVVLLRPEIAVIGEFDTSAATGAVDTATTLQGYIKQLVTDVRTVANDVANIDGSSIPTMVGTDGAFLGTSGARILVTPPPFWSAPALSVTVTGSQTTVTTGLNNVVVAGLPTGMTVTRAIALMMFRMVENTYAGVNKLDAASALPLQLDDVGDTGMLTCQDFLDDLFTLADSTREGGTIIMGSIDVKARVDGNDTYDFQWFNAKADQNNIVFHDVQMGLLITYSI